jgi:hypothetical protein
MTEDAKNLAANVEEKVSQDLIKKYEAQIESARREEKAQILEMMGLALKNGRLPGDNDSNFEAQISQLKDQLEVANKRSEEAERELEGLRKYMSEYVVKAHNSQLSFLGKLTDAQKSIPRLEAEIAALKKELEAATLKKESATATTGTAEKGAGTGAPISVAKHAYLARNSNPALYSGSRWGAGELNRIAREEGRVVVSVPPQSHTAATAAATKVSGSIANAAYVARSKNTEALSGRWGQGELDRLKREGFSGAAAASSTASVSGSAHTAAAAAYAVRSKDTDALSSRWGPGELNRLAREGHTSHDSQNHDVPAAKAYAARSENVASLSSRWGNGEISRLAAEKKTQNTLVSH